MKKLIPLTLALFVSVPALAQSQKHMILFDADSILQGAWSLSRVKEKGSGPDSESQLNLRLNYFYTVPKLKQLQVGGAFLYQKDTGLTGNFENYGGQIGAIWNFDKNLEKALYLKGLVGLTWNNEYGANSNSDEQYNLTAAVGKRFSLADYGLRHVTWTPEIAYTAKDSTTKGDFDYSSAIEFRFLQFSVLF
jgi:hypothetical protein